MRIIILMTIYSRFLFNGLFVVNVRILVFLNKEIKLQEMYNKSTYLQFTMTCPSHEGLWPKAEIQGNLIKFINPGKMLCEEKRGYLQRHLGHSASVHEKFYVKV